MIKQKVTISFSGGKTSAYMTNMLLKTFRKSDRFDWVVLFANTGCEHPATYDFIRDCDTHLGFNTVWVEADISPIKGIANRARVVTYETASRNGEPFERIIQKKGIPTPNQPFCTGDLKERTMVAYLKNQLNWVKGTWWTYIGIRADEADRCNYSESEYNLKYPLVHQEITLKDIEAELSTWPFQLQLPGKHYGNCVWCWKKSWRKLLTIAKHNPQAFDFPLRMEQTYGGDRKFFREHRTVKDLLEQAPRLPMQKEYVDNMVIEFDERFDLGTGCEGSCEPFNIT